MRLFYTEQIEFDEDGRMTGDKYVQIYDIRGKEYIYRIFDLTIRLDTNSKEEISEYLDFENEYKDYTLEKL